MKTLLIIIGFIFLGINIISITPISFLTDIWFLDIFSHFRLQILLFILISLIVLFLVYLKYYGKQGKIDNYKIYFYIMIPIIIILSFTEPLLTSILGNIKTSNDMGGIKIFYQNIQREIDNNNLDKIYNQILESNVEIVTVVENSYEFNDYMYDKGWKRISGNKKTECAGYIKRDNNIQIDSEIIKTKVNYDICKFAYNDVNIFIVHPHPPMNKGQFDRWNGFFGELVSITDKIILEGEKMIIVGDFNATIYNSNFRNSFNHIYKKSFYSRHSLNILSVILTLTIVHLFSNINNINFNVLDYTSSDHRSFIINY